MVWVCGCVFVPIAPFFCPVRYLLLFVCRPGLAEPFLSRFSLWFLLLARGGGGVCRGTPMPKPRMAKHKEYDCMLDLMCFEEIHEKRVNALPWRRWPTCGTQRAIT